MIKVSLSDCIKCWETPCRCGYEYKDWSEKDMVKFLYDITSHFDRKEIFKILHEITKED